MRWVEKDRELAESGAHQVSIELQQEFRHVPCLDVTPDNEWVTIPTIFI